MCPADSVTQVLSRVSLLPAPTEGASACNNPVTNQALLEFVRTATWPIIVFEAVVVAITIATLLYLRRSMPRIVPHYLALVAGVLIFEVFTAPMWLNERLGPWAYYYQDVSWVLTVGWATMILIGLVLVDRLFGHYREWQRFGLALLVLTPVALVAERVVVLLGIRTYAPEVLERVGNLTIPLLGVYAAALYYIPVFLALIIGFYKYWVPVIEQHPEPELARPSLLRRLILMVIGVFLFEIMIEPMVNNRNFPQWSYVLYDISLLMTGFWVLLLTICTYAIDLIFRQANLRLRFAAYLLFIGLIAAPIEGWFIRSGFRDYGPSAVANFSGFRTALGDIPIEAALAVPLYLALVIASVRYWERIGTYQTALTPSAPPVEAPRPASGPATSAPA